MERFLYCWIALIWMEPQRLFEESERSLRPQSSKTELGIGPSKLLLLKSRVSNRKAEMLENSLIWLENRLLESSNFCSAGRENREIGILPWNALLRKLRFTRFRSSSHRVELIPPVRTLWERTISVKFLVMLNDGIGPVKLFTDMSK